MGVNSLPKTVTGQRRGYDLNPTAPESSTLTTRLPSHSACTRLLARGCLPKTVNSVSLQSVQTMWQSEICIRHHYEFAVNDFALTVLQTMIRFVSNRTWGPKDHSHSLIHTQ